MGSHYVGSFEIRMTKLLIFDLVDVNAAFEVITDIKREDAIGKLVTNTLPGIDETDLLQIFGNIAQTGEAQRFERYYAPMGRYFLVTAFLTAPDQFATIFMDITERREAEEVLRDSEANFRVLFDSMAQGNYLPGQIREDYLSK